MQSTFSVNTVTRFLLIAIAFVATTSITRAQTNSSEKTIQPERVGVETADALPFRNGCNR